MYPPVQEALYGYPCIGRLDRQTRLDRHVQTACGDKLADGPVQIDLSMFLGKGRSLARTAYLILHMVTTSSDRPAAAVLPRLWLQVQIQLQRLWPVQHLRYG